ncbi:MAG: hypothetical protein C0513_09155 [Isosphaera sp.]|nr:hypothetical protein [Isosphaera sp.]
MGQIGLNLPGGQIRRGAQMNLYTGLLLVAVVALAAACVMVYVQGSKLGKDGSAIGIQQRGQLTFKP